jgi:uncharacterized MnhB-related membrane protein
MLPRADVVAVVRRLALQAVDVVIVRAPLRSPVIPCVVAVTVSGVHLLDGVEAMSTS